MADQPGRVWLITGASSGIGRAVAAQALAAGDTVIGTFRSSAQADAFSQSSDRAHGAVADVCDAAQVEAAVNTLGRVDVVVNAAGYAMVGAVEELSDAEMRAQLDVNFHGTHRVVRAALPIMRAQGHGVIVNITSVAGVVGAAGLGAYDASKAAVELLSEALRAEVTPFGVRVLVVEPGNVRTQWAGRSMQTAAIELDAYAATAGANRTFFHELNGQQVGDPDDVAAAICAAVAADDPSFRLVLGDDAHGWIVDKLEEQEADLARWQPSS